MSDDAPPRLRCSACRSTDLTEEAEYASFENHVHFPEREEEGLLGPKPLRIAPRKGRICLACGHVMAFLDAAQLAALRASPRIVW